jgi:exopolysaccharide biosynthesis polyprenyl glycosylphosphotransferase
MTPPPAASHAANGSLQFTPRRAASAVAANTASRLLDHMAWSKVRLLVDVTVLYLAAGAALFADPMHAAASNRVLAALFPPMVAAIMQARRGPDQRLYGSVVDTTSYLLGIVSLAAMLGIAFESVLGSSRPLDLALRLWLFSFVYLATARIVLLSIRRQAMRSKALATPTLIIGAGFVGEHLVNRLAGESRYGLRPVGFLDADPLPSSRRSIPSRLPVFGGSDDLESAVRRTGARHVIIAFSSEPDHVLVDRVRECERLGLQVSLVPRLYESISDRATLDHVGGMPLLTLHSVDPKGWQFAIKHTVDRVVALLALIVAAPLMLSIALAIRMSSPGPIMFRQRRVGRDGHEFDVLKFRTMRVLAPSEAEFELKDGCAPGGVEGDDRRTGIGRYLRDFSLDELPQFINVLRGDMSLVGPRPERPEFVRQFAREVARYDDRLRVKSGITGWAQVNGLRGQTSIADRVEWDNYYIRNWSLRFDLRIAIMTIAEVLQFRDSASAVPPPSATESHPAAAQQAPRAVA